MRIADFLVQVFSWRGGVFGHPLLSLFRSRFARIDPLPQLSCPPQHRQNHLLLPPHPPHAHRIRVRLAMTSCQTATLWRHNNTSFFVIFSVRWEADKLNKDWFDSNSFVPTQKYDTSMEYMAIWLWGASLAAYIAHMVRTIICCLCLVCVNKNKDSWSHSLRAM